MAQLGRAGHFPVLWMVKLTHIIAVQLTTTLSANLCFGI
jgi:hypothetical protein